MLRARGQAWLSTLTEEVDRRLGPAAGATAGLGRLVVAFWQGLLTVWSFTRTAPVATVVREALVDLLGRLVTNSGSLPPR